MAVGEVIDLLSSDVEPSPQKRYNVQASASLQRDNEYASLISGLSSTRKRQRLSGSKALNATSPIRVRSPKTRQQLGTSPHAPRHDVWLRIDSDEALPSPKVPQVDPVDLRQAISDAVSEPTARNDAVVSYDLDSQSPPTLLAKISTSQSEGFVEGSSPHGRPRCPPAPRQGIISTDTTNDDREITNTDPTVAIISDPDELQPLEHVDHDDLLSNASSLDDDFIYGANSGQQLSLSDRTANLLADLDHDLPTHARVRKKASATSRSDTAARYSDESIERTDAKAGRIPLNTKVADEDLNQANEKAAKLLEKENMKEQKAREKEEEKARKKLQKEEKAKEKQIAAELAEVNKSKIDKKDTTPEMMVDLPASMDGSALHRQTCEYLKNLGVDTTLYQSNIPNVVKWRRKVKARWNTEMEHWEPLTRMEVVDEKHILCHMPAKDLVSLIMSDSAANNEHMESHVLSLKSAHVNAIPIYLVEGLVAYQKKHKNAENRAFQARVLADDNGSIGRSSQQQPAVEVLDEDRIEDALLRLQVVHDCLIYHTTSARDSAEWIANYTQHISTIPYRQQRMNLSTTVCMESGQVKTGEDNDDTFVKMLQEVNRVTPSIAYGIVVKYPNVVKLLEAFRKGGPLILENLQKNANRNGAIANQRIGPAISRRLYKVFTELDPRSTDV